MALAQSLREARRLWYRAAFQHSKGFPRGLVDRLEARSGWLRVSVGGVGEVEAEVMRVDVRVRRYIEHSFMMNTIGLFEVLVLHAEVMNRKWEMIASEIRAR